MKQLLLKLSAAIRERVRPWVLEARGGEVVGRAHSGDATFRVDEIAEDHLAELMKKMDEPIACLSEDKGLMMPEHGRPQWLLVVDPLDGSRNAKSGFEACMVSVALAKFSERPTLADVTHGLLHEIVGERVFYAERNASAEVWMNDRMSAPELSSNEDLSTLRWSLTMPGRPASLVFGVMANLIEASSLRGGFFSCNSTCYSISRLLTNQLDAYVDVANRIVRERASSDEEFRAISKRCLTGFSSYDIAAALLIAKQGGVTITDAYGGPLDDMELLDTSPTNMRSCVAAATSGLHAKILGYIDDAIGSLKIS